MDAHVPEYIDREPLGLYLADHLTGAAAGLSHMRRMARTTAGTPLAPELARIAAEIGEEHAELERMVDRFGFHQRRHRRAMAWGIERISRLKLERHLFSDSPIKLVLELEVMRSAVVGKLGVWQTLAELAPDLGLDRARLEALAARSRVHFDVLDGLHEQVRSNHLRGDRP